MKQNREIVAGSVVTIVLVGVIVWIMLAKFAKPSEHNIVSVSSTTPSTVSKTSATTKPVGIAHITYHAPTKTISKSYASALTVDPRDTITSWSTSVQATPAVKKQIKKEILKLSTSISKVQDKNYNTFLQIAQDYELLSDGKSAYNFYVLAAKANPSNGLAWSNIGNLMERLGAYHTAHNAYAASVAISPTIEQYWISYLDFLSIHEPLAASTGPVFVAAARATKSAPNVLIIMANWEASIGKFSVAIADWRLVRAKVGTIQQKAIDTKIKSLQKNSSHVNSQN